MKKNLHVFGREAMQMCRKHSREFSRSDRRASRKPSRNVYVRLH